MMLESHWIFNSSPEHIWPHFFQAEMDRSRPLLFRLGIPKPLSCRVLEGVPAVGNTRQCTTDQGTINQRIVVLKPFRQLTYQMQDSTVWCRQWIGCLEDTFTLDPLPNGQTQVRRKTQFKGAGLLAPLKTLALRIALAQAHRYAAKNWRRLALLSQAGD